MTAFLQFLMRRDITANWTSANPVLAQGELGLDTTLNRFKIGDGTTAYNSLAYAPNTVFGGTGAPSAGLGVNGDIYFDTTTGATKIYGPKAAGSWGSGVTLTGATGPTGPTGPTNITALTGDVTASGSGSVPATLATVNANTGSWGTASSVPQFTVNGKGLVTAASNVQIATTSAQVADFSNAAQDAALQGRHVVDTFNRTVSGGWGSTNTGEAWSSSGAVYSVAAGSGAIDLSAAGVQNIYTSITALGSDQDVYADFTWGSTVTGSLVFTALYARSDAALPANAYYLQTTLTTSAGYTCTLGKFVASAGTQLSSAFTTGSWAPGTTLRTRLQVVGTQIRAKVWATTASEPATWQATVTDSSVISGSLVVLESNKNSGNTSTTQIMSWDNLRVYTGTPLVAANSVENSNLYPMPANTLKGNNTGGTANPLDLTPAQVATMVNGSIVIAESQVTNLVTDLAAKVGTTRLINTTAPLTGGGDLSADRTLAISQATATTVGSIGPTTVTSPKDLGGGVVYITAGNPQGWAGSDIGAWVNAAFAYLVANYATGVNGGTIRIGSGSFNQSTAIDIGQLGFSIILEGNGDGNGSTILNYTPTTGIAIGIGGASGNDGGVQVRNLTLTGSSAANATTAIRWGASTVGTAGASAWNVSIRRFGIGMDWRTGSVTYAVNLFNCKIQQCTTGIKPAGEANNMFGGLIANCATGMDASNSGTDFEGFGVAFDDNTTWAINANSTTFRGTLTSCRFENAGAGTSNYITMSNGSLVIIGGSMQDDVNTGSATGFVQCTGGNFYLAGTWIASVGRTYANPFVMGTGMTNVQISGVLAPGSSGISAKQLQVNGGNMNGNSITAATASFSTTPLQVLPPFIPSPGEVQPGSTYKFEIHAQVINTATATNLFAQVAVGGTNVGVSAGMVIGTTAHASPGLQYLITGMITFVTATSAESVVAIIPSFGSVTSGAGNLGLNSGGTQSAPIAVPANSALQCLVSTSGASSTVIVRQAVVYKVY